MPYVNEGKLDRLNATINNSPTMIEKAGAGIDAPAHKAVMYDGDGNVVLATSGDKAVGLILSASIDPIQEGQSVNFLIKNIGLAEAGAEIAKGDLVTVNSSGQIVPAESGAFIFGRAFATASAAGECILVQINQMGYMA